MLGGEVGGGILKAERDLATEEAGVKTGERTAVVVGESPASVSFDRLRRPPALENGSDASTTRILPSVTLGVSEFPPLLLPNGDLGTVPEIHRLIVAASEPPRAPGRAAPITSAPEGRCLAFAHSSSPTPTTLFDDEELPWSTEIEALANQIQPHPNRTRVHLVHLLSPAERTRSVCFWVHDRGTGILPVHFHRIFRPFQQIDAETSQGGGGHGFGLSICLALADLQRGMIGFQSHPGVGTLFYVWLRLSEAPSTGSSSEMLGASDSAPAATSTAVRIHTAGHPGSFLLPTHHVVEVSVAGSLTDSDDRRAIESAATSRLSPARPDARARDYVTAEMEEAGKLDIGLAKPQVRGQRRTRKPRTTRVPGTPGEPETVAEPMPRGRVLIVDDAADIRIAFRRCLRHAGFRTHEAEDGIAALERLREYVGDDECPWIAVILDREMSPMGGIECLRRMKGDPAFNAIPVLGLTGDAGQDTKEAFMEAGAVAALAKPLSPTELLKAVREIVHDRSSAR